MLLSEEERAKYLRTMRSPHADALRKAALFKKIVERCKKTNTCYYCQALNGKARRKGGHSAWLRTAASE